MDDLAPDLEQQETDTPVPADDPEREQSDLGEPLFEPEDDVAGDASGDAAAGSRLDEDG
jgi:hypothetical protein